VTPAAPPGPGPGPGISFRESRYLGLRHPSGSLTGWTALTTGLPAVLGVPWRYQRLAAELAALQGHPAALLTRSTLHGFIDVLYALKARGAVILADARVYAIARLAVTAVGLPCEFFRHHDAADQGTAGAAGSSRPPGGTHRRGMPRMRSGGSARGVPPPRGRQRRAARR
jgi:7-keto-8-aminopelargonate synthetase-like enzyme